MISYGSFLRVWWRLVMKHCVSRHDDGRRFPPAVKAVDTVLCGGSVGLSGRHDLVADPAPPFGETNVVELGLVARWAPRSRTAAKACCVPHRLQVNSRFKTAGNAVQVVCFPGYGFGGFCDIDGCK